MTHGSAVSSMMTDYAEAKHLASKAAVWIQNAADTAHTVSQPVVVASQRLRDDIDALITSLDAAIRYLDQIQSTT